MKHTEIDQDKALQDLHELHKQYQAVSNELPTPDLDEQIIQAAHKAIESNDRGGAKTGNKNLSGIDTQSVKRAWYVPVSYVAILVISLSVVMKLAIEPEMSANPSEADGTFYTDEKSVEARRKENQLPEEVVSSSLGSEFQEKTVEEKKIHKSTLNDAVPGVRSAKPKAVEPVVSRLGMNQQSLPDSEIADVNKVEIKVPSIVVTGKAYAEKNLAKSNAAMAQSERLAEQKMAKAKARVKPQQTQMHSSGQQAGVLASAEERAMETPELAVAKTRKRKKESLNQVATVKDDEKILAAPEKAIASKADSQINDAQINDAQIKNDSITERQQLKIDALMALYEKKRYKALGKALLEYRKDYPLLETGDALPQVLLDWESENISKLSQKQQ